MNGMRTIMRICMDREDGMSSTCTERVACCLSTHICLMIGSVSEDGQMKRKCVHTRWNEMRCPHDEFFSCSTSNFPTCSSTVSFQQCILQLSFVVCCQRALSPYSSKVQRRINMACRISLDKHEVRSQTLTYLASVSESETARHHACCALERFDWGEAAPIHEEGEFVVKRETPCCSQRWFGGVGAAAIRMRC